MKFQDLLAYKKSFALAMEIFGISKKLPNEEQYALTDQVRRSSRSVTANIFESYAKGRYPKCFRSQLMDGDGENLETRPWPEFAKARKYISQEEFDKPFKQTVEIAKLMHFMI